MGTRDGEFPVHVNPGLHAQADVLWFAAESFALLGAAWWALGPEPPPHRMDSPALLTLLVVAADVWSERSAGAADARMRGMDRGLAPTYSPELDRQGRASPAMDAAETDPVYPALIDTEKRWFSIHPAVSDIAAYRRLTDGRWVRFVDSETGWDGDGQSSSSKRRSRP